MQALDIIQSLSEQHSGNDMAEAAALLGEHFRHKYITPIKHSFDEKCSYCSQNPSPRVNLLKAFLPFVKDGKGLEKMIELLTRYDAAAEMVRECYRKVHSNKNKTIADEKEKNFFPKENVVNEENIPVVALMLIILANRIQ